jgi:hypothetical protein
LVRTFSNGFSRADFLKIAGGKQIVVFTMAAKKAGDVRTQGDDAQVVRTRKIERGAGELGAYSVALERRGNFCVLEHEAVGEAAISDERTEAVYDGFEAMGCFVVGDSDGVQV